MSLLGEVHTVYLGFHFHCIPHFVPKRCCLCAVFTVSTAFVIQIYLQANLQKY
jgi:hypothetical protein